MLWCATFNPIITDLACTVALDGLETDFDLGRSSDMTSIILNHDVTGAIRLAKDAKMPVVQVLRGFRRKKNLDSPTKLTKFKESLWRGSFYSFAVVLGMWTLWDEPVAVFAHFFPWLRRSPFRWFMATSVTSEQAKVCDVRAGEGV
jgi:hypothetical protein